jgi:hypothetical protein
VCAFVFFFATSFFLATTRILPRVCIDIRVLEKNQGWTLHKPSAPAKMTQ